MSVAPRIQSALDPQGPHARAIDELTGPLFYGGALILVLVLAFAAWALWAPPRYRRWMTREGFVIGWGIAFPVVVLTGLLVYSLPVMRSATVMTTPADVTIEVTAYQWWWRVHYLDAAGKTEFATANEIRIPAGRAVDLVLRTQDVIHSFWVPNLAGKLDMIPGHVKRLRISADQPGTFRGQCAEYCGGPHAQMALHVIALAAADYETWRERERRAAVEPADAARESGRRLFLAHCGACHTVRGTPARGSLAPDLTHVASRISLAAGILPNTPAALEAWIVRSQQVKPRNLMPSLDIFTREELRALVAYVGSLQ